MKDFVKLYNYIPGTDLYFSLNISLLKLDFSFQLLPAENGILIEKNMRSSLSSVRLGPHLFTFIFRNLYMYKCSNLTKIKHKIKIAQKAELNRSDANRLQV